MLLYGEHAFWIGAVLEQLRSTTAAAAASPGPALFEVVANLKAAASLSTLVGGKGAGWKRAVALATADDASRQLLLWDPFPHPQTLRSDYLAGIVAAACGSGAVDVAPRWLEVRGLLVESRSLVESNYVGLFDGGGGGGASGSETRHDNDGASLGFDLSHFNSLSPPTRAVRLEDLRDLTLLSEPFTVWTADLQRVATATATATTTKSFYTG